jgi:hypothetical protein
MRRCGNGGGEVGKTSCSINTLTIFQTLSNLNNTLISTLNPALINSLRNSRLLSGCTQPNQSYMSEKKHSKGIEDIDFAHIISVGLHAF